MSKLQDATKDIRVKRGLDEPEPEAPAEEEAAVVEAEDLVTEPVAEDEDDG